MQVKVLTLDISLVKPNTKNPRVIKDESYQKLVQSIKDFPEMLEVREIVCDENLIILGGNQRYNASIDAGMTTVRVKQVLGWTDKQKEQFIIKDNVNNGEWDYDALLNGDFDINDLESWGVDVPDVIEEEHIDLEEFFKEDDLVTKESFKLTIEFDSSDDLENVKTALLETDSNITKALMKVLEL